MDLDQNLDFMDSEVVDLYDDFDTYEMYMIYKLYRLNNGHRFASIRKRKVEKNKVKRKNALHKNLTYKERQKMGILSSLVPDLIEDVRKFKKYCRVSPHLFQSLLDALGKDIKKCDTNFKNAIDPEVKLMLTLRYLATGESYESLHSRFDIGRSTVRYIIYEVCKSILKILGPIELPRQTAESLEETADVFYKRWQYPHCVGAIASRVIRLERPIDTTFHKQKKTKAILLQGVTNADGIFTFVDTCDYDFAGKEFNFRESGLANMMICKDIPFPEKKPIDNSDPLPYVFIADSCYPLLKHVMRPYPVRGQNDTKRTFNHRHSEARQVAEQTFNKMMLRWKVLMTIFKRLPEKVKLIAESCCVLHNFVTKREKSADQNDFVVEYGTDDRYFAGSKPIHPKNGYGRPQDADLLARDGLAKHMFMENPYKVTPTANFSIPDENNTDDVNQPRPDDCNEIEAVDDMCNKGTADDILSDEIKLSQINEENGNVKIEMKQEVLDREMSVQNEEVSDEGEVVEIKQEVLDEEMSVENKDDLSDEGEVVEIKQELSDEKSDNKFIQF